MENRVVCKFVTFYKHHIACSREENAEMLNILTYWEYQIALVALSKNTVSREIDVFYEEQIVFMSLGKNTELCKLSDIFYIKSHL